MNKKLFLFLGLLFMLFFVSATYQTTNPAWTNAGGYSGFGFGHQDQECEAGQDFVLQLMPFGCEPAVVRSDLLEEQDAPIFCKLAVTKINPFIDVNVIESMTFRGESNAAVRDLAFMPDRAALRTDVGVLDSSLLDNIGYFIVVLKQTPESELENCEDAEFLGIDAGEVCWVKGDVTATLRYDIGNAFGIGEQYFYLSEMTDDDFEENFKQFSFWNGRGYVRAEGIDEDSAAISIYNEQRKLQSFNLDKGETSNPYYFEGFDCLAGLNVKLDGLENPDTFVKIMVNGDSFELKEGETFLEGNCKILDLEKNGLTQSVSGRCTTLEGKENFKLEIIPQVNLSICDEDKKNCVPGIFKEGDVLYDGISPGDSRKVFLGYIGENQKTNEKYVIPVISTAKDSEEFLDSFDYSFIKTYGEYIAENSFEGVTFFDVIDSILDKSLISPARFVNNIFSGSDYGEWIVEGDEKVSSFASEDFKAFGPKVLSFLNSDWASPEYKKKLIKFNGFYGSTDLDLRSLDPHGKDINIFYNKAIADYDYVLKNLASTMYDPGKEYEGETKAEESLIAKIRLANYLKQKEALLSYCDELKEEYPGSDYVDMFFNQDEKICSDLVRLSSSEESVAHVLIDGNIKEFVLEGIYEPGVKDYSVEISIDGAPYILTKDNPVYFEGTSAGIETKDGWDTTRSENELKNAIKNSDWKNEVKTKCLNYVDELVDVGAEEKIDPLLLLALMYQESKCEASEDSGSSVGLMQINLKHCGSTFGDNTLPFDSSKCEKELKENVKLNIEVGASILKQGYSSEPFPYKCNEYKFTKTKDYLNKVEPAIDKNYVGWSRALRFYNGKGCAGLSDDEKTEILADHSFVEDVTKIYNGLGGNFEGSATSVNSGSLESIKLVDLGVDYAKFDVSGIKHSSVLKSLTYSVGALSIGLKDSEVVGDNKYRIKVNKINLKKVAKVKLYPTIDNQESEVNFTYKIGIEKRAIQLSPEKIEDKIESLENTIEDFKSLSDKLGKVVKAMKATCYGTGLLMTLKNLLFTPGEESIARLAVMRNDGGWYDVCAGEVAATTYSSIENCLSAKSKEIDNSVKEWYNSGTKKQSDEIDNLQEKYGDSFAQKYCEEIKKDLEPKLREKLEVPTENIKIGNDAIDLTNFVKTLDASNVAIEDLRDLDLYASVEVTDESMKVMVQKNLKTLIKQIYEDTEKILALEKAQKDAASDGLSGLSYQVVAGEDSKTIIYNGYRATSDLEKTDIKKDMLLQGILVGNVNKIVELERVQGTTDTYRVVAVYDSKGKKLGEEESRFANDLIFKKYDSSTYENPYLYSAGASEPLLRYYETAPYAGLPAIVPFDKDKGWYASVPQTISAGATNAYDKSGVVTSFYLCNIGENKKEETRGGDDICELVNRNTGMAYDGFHGINDEDEVKQLIKDAEEAISQASNQHSSGVQYVNIKIRGRNGNSAWRIKVGEPAVDISDTQCQDFMSPADCKFLFNVCDPVVCPSSRCNLGGAYTVSNVAATGIFGSVALCWPNGVWKGGDIYIPVCLTGVKAGLDLWNSVLQSYHDCLETNLETGETVGICDELHSFYGCEFWWKQMAVFADLGLSKGIEFLKGSDGSKGGGEYLGFNAAMKNAEDSLDYFTNYYGANVNSAFKVRSTEEIGSEFCKVAIYGTIPLGDTVLDSVVDTDAGPQYYGSFEEIKYTTVTNPPTSHYKVYYHIYPGENSGAYYKVYLKRDSSSSFYQDTSSSYVVDYGYADAGGYATNTNDFTAASGYNQLCIMVNDQEECGFKSVSTNYGVNYIKDQYVAGQAKSNVTSTSECVEGSSSWMSFANLNLEAGLNEAINPEIYNYNILRTCATESPGKGTDDDWNTKSARWVDVGYCDDKNMRCWLDTDSVEEAIKDLDLEGEVLDELGKEFQEKVLASGDYISDNANFAELLNGFNKTDETSDSEVILRNIDFLNGIFEKLLWPNHKGQTYFLRGGEYGKLAMQYYGRWKEANKEEEKTPDKDEIKVVKEEDYIITPFVGEVVFKINDVYYTYFSGEWRFSIDNGLWIDIPAIKSYVNSFSSDSQGDVLNYIPDFLSAFMSLPPEDEDFILEFIADDNINTVNYDLGVLMLMSRAETDDLVLSSGVVDYLSSGYFRVSGLETFDANFLYLGFSEGENNWIWGGGNTLPDKWHLIKQESLERDNNLFTVDYASVFKTVYGEGYLEGAKNLFDYGSNYEGEAEETEKEILEKEISGKDSCEDCGGSFFDIDACKMDECMAIGLRDHKFCSYTDVFGIFSPGGGCVEKTKYTLEGALKEVDFLEGDFSEGYNNYFLYALYVSDILTLQEYNQIQKNKINYLKKVLATKK